MKSTVYVLWGRHPAYAPVPIKITGGRLQDCYAEARWRFRCGGWSKLVIRLRGQAAE